MSRSKRDAARAFIERAAGEILATLDDDQIVASVLVGTIDDAGAEIHYFVIAGKPGVQRTLMLPDSPEAAQARELLSRASVNLTAPDTPAHLRSDDQ